jgi:HD superfamily phosphohydrolase
MFGPRYIFSILLFCISLIACLESKELSLESIYGTIQISDPLILDLLETSSMQRMVDIDQHGIYYFRKESPTFNRYQHSIGVYYLLKRYKTSLIEQAAGLVHDISHTIFSHLSDIIYNHDEKLISYQDSIHYWYLNKINLKKILDKYNYTVNDLLFKNGTYSGLDQPLPDICADRLDYNLETGYVFNFITKEDIQMILNDLSFKNNRWFFNTPSIAKKFASLSLYFTENFWGSDWNTVIYKLSASAFQRGLNFKVITFDDLHFSTDKVILDKLKNQKDSVIDSYLKKCCNHTHHYTKGTKENHNYSFFPKFRGINPWVKVENQFFRLTSLDLDFSLDYQRVKQAMNQGFYLNIDLSI